MDSQTPCFFMGANSPGGFHSFFDWLIDLNTARDIYIIKGGPGCRKTAFLRRVENKLHEYGWDGEEILSHTDPDSLDAVVFPLQGIAVADGTAPHIIEPKIPGAVDHYLCLDAFYDRDALKKKREEVTLLQDEITQNGARATRCLSAARCLQDDIYNTIIRGVTPGRIAKRARGVIGRELPRRAGVSATKKRFLSGFTAQGSVCLFETGRSICEKIYEVNDNYGLSPFFLTPILTAAQKAGLSIYACYCPLEPESRLEHIFLPELSLGFVRSSTLHPYDAEPYRRIRLDPSCDPALLKKYRQRLRFEKKTAAALIEDACACLARTVESSARLDGLYAPHVDLDGIYASADHLAEKLLTNR